ncbi:hypothetical protein [Faecalibacter rhinopitheci]|uniref:Uncharacterized protein n=1 Tax=Faecalibacter rhinopitheci TaxID=2779678 RepID=A0A8J7K4H0_9FLAO|nr:hypothetical protein [Faecalibacter rhinopitheci]MBF0597559.1 hypothetical protein [Faecalibacter rhinopitheci]
MKIYTLFILTFFTFIAHAQQLDQDTINLNETVLFDKTKFKLKRVGPDTKSKTVLVGLKADLNMKKDSLPKIVKGFSVYINAPKKSYTVEQLNFNFGNLLTEDVKLKIDLRKQLDSESLLEKPLFLTINQDQQDEEHVFHYNLKEQNIKGNDAFYIYVELLEESQKPVFFNAAMFSKCYYQPENDKQWHKTPLGIAPSINADLLIKK